MSSVAGPVDGEDPLEIQVHEDGVSCVGQDLRAVPQSLGPVRERRERMFLFCFCEEKGPSTCGFRCMAPLQNHWI